jgi:hypothetical protein
MNAVDVATTRIGTRGSRQIAARSVLQDRVLTVLNADNANLVIESIHPTHGGVVLTGAKRLQVMSRLRRAYPELVVIAEPDSHASLNAGPNRFWHLPGDDDGLIPPASVHEVLDAQRHAGASVALLPAGYVSAGDHETLRALVDAANDIDGDDVALPLYLDGGWLRQDHLDYLRAVIHHSRHLVLLAFGSTTNPLNTAKKVGLYLDLVAAGAVCWRTDLAGLAGVSRGAIGAAIGMAPAMRRVTAPDNTGKARRPGDTTPYVLLASHMRWLKTGAMRGEIFVAAPAPSCLCQECRGRLLDRFDEHQKAQATRHNQAVVDGFTRQLFDVAPAERAAMWRQLAREAAIAHDVTSGQIGRPWKVPQDVELFAGL